MSKAGNILLALIFLSFVAYVVYSSIHLDRYSCEVCMTYRGMTNCGTATGVTELEARNTATTVACATITAGVTEGIACGNTLPKSVDCRQK